MDTKCPLSEEDCQRLNWLLQSCSDTKCLLEKLESIGLDTSKLREDNDYHHAFSTRTKAQFFPDHP